jgi:hypothetical protein
MATLEQIGAALKAADAAGNVDDAKRLAAAYRQMQAGAQTGAPRVQTLQGKVGKMDPAQAGVSENVQGLPAQDAYGFELNRMRRTYYPQLSDEQWQAAINDPITNLKPADAPGLLNDGLTMGLSDEARGAAGFMTGLTSGKDPFQAFKDFQAFEQARRSAGAETAGGVGMAAQIGGAVLAGRPDMAATKVAGLLPSIWQGGKQAAQQGAVYGFASTEGDLGDRARGALTGAATSAAFGAAVPAVVGGVKKIISPFGGSSGKRAAANVLAKEGVELTAGQATGSKGLQYRESELGGAAAEVFMEKQADQFTAAALKRVGVNANRATPDVIDTAFDTIGQQFDDLAARNGLKTDAKLMTDLQDAWKRFENVTNESTRPRFVENFMRDIAQKMRTGYAFLDGNWYKSTRSELNRIMRSSSNPEFKEALREIQGAMDDAMERSLRQVNPADLGAWKEARRLYRNMFVIEDAATRAGAASAEGIITPQALRSAAMRQNKRAFARGKNEFVDLANAGVSALTPLPNSGTAGRLNARTLIPGGIGAGVGATIGNAIVPGAGGFAGAAIGAAAPWAVGQAMLSGVGRRYLGNQVAGPVTGQASQLGALLGRGAQPLLPAKGR